MVFKCLWKDLVYFKCLMQLNVNRRFQMRWKQVIVSLILQQPI